LYILPAYFSPLPSIHFGQNTTAYRANFPHTTYAGQLVWSWVETPHHPLPCPAVRAPFGPNCWPLMSAASVWLTSFNLFIFNMLHTAVGRLPRRRPPNFTTQ